MNLLDAIDSTNVNRGKRVNEDCEGGQKKNLHFMYDSNSVFAIVYESWS